MNEVLKFGSKEMKKVTEATGDYAKFDLGKVYEVEVIGEFATPRMAEFDGKEYQRYDIKIKVGGQEKTWGVSKTVLGIMNDNFETKRFNVVRTERNYSVIPLK